MDVARLQAAITELPFAIGSANTNREEVQFKVGLCCKQQEVLLLMLSYGNNDDVMSSSRLLNNYFAVLFARICVLEVESILRFDDN